MKCILMDVEGTTTSINFVHDTLFPFSKDNLINFLEKEFNNKDNAEIQEALKEIAKIGLEEKLYSGSFNQEIALRVLLHLINKDSKASALKTIQGFQWKQGYEQGKIIGHVYPDVPECFSEWVERDLTLAIYSSGSVLAQKLLFSHTKHGDLQKFLKHNFDTSVGNKREAESYKKIITDLKMDPSDVVFLSDIPEELIAAKSSGLKVIHVTRNGTKTHPEFKNIRDFTELEDTLENYDVDLESKEEN